MFLEANNVLNAIAVLDFLLKNLWRKMGGGIVISHFEDVKSVGEKSYKQ